MPREPKCKECKGKDSCKVRKPAEETYRILVEVEAGRMERPANFLEMTCIDTIEFDEVISERVREALEWTYSRQKHLN